MAEYKVRQGDCMASIAGQFGFGWKKLWEHPSNAELREKRKNPNVLMEGDTVFIPEKTKRVEEVSTGRLHKFRLKGYPSLARVRLQEQGRPRSNLDYTIELEDGTELSGKTADDGVITLAVSPEVRSGELILRSEKGSEVHSLKFGHLDPVAEISGIQQRLRNLGIRCPVTGRLDDPTKRAILEFQSIHEDLKDSGEPDPSTRQKLVEVHGS